MKKICVVGIGIIDALGHNQDMCFNNLISKEDFLRDYTSEIFTPSDKIYCKMGLYPYQEFINKKIPDKALSRSMKYALHSTEQALLSSGLPIINNVATIFSSGTAGHEKLLDMFSSKKLYPKTVVNGANYSISSYISEKYKFKGINTGFLSACATGLVSIDYAMAIADQYEYVVVGCTDSGINEIDMAYMCSGKALGTISRPFDIYRDGFIMGEGSGCLILQTEEKARHYGSKILAYLYPVSHFSDAYHPSVPSGEGALESMKKAISFIADPQHIVVNAHATSTTIGDIIEYKAIKNIISNCPIYSVKGKIGHTMTSAGLIETIYAILSMKNSIIPYNHNINETDMDVNRENLEQHIRYTLKNSFGVGGRNCSMVIENV